jgi:putative DNA primase/helicase
MPTPDANGREWSDDQIADEVIEQLDEKPDLLPTPSAPMRVARYLLADQTHDGQLTIRSWRDGWMRWQGSHWSEVDPAEVRSMVYHATENAHYLDTTRKVPEVVAWHPTRHKVANVVEALAAAAHLNSLTDAPAWVVVRSGPRSKALHIAVANGLLDVETRELIDHTPAFFNLASVPFAYDPEAAEPKRWLEFLADLWPDDADSISALQEFFGYVISGRTDLQKMLLLVGPTRGGKGTIVRILTLLVGSANVAGPTLSSLATNFGLAPLIGKPLAVISDARLGGSNIHQVVERLLSISGEDTLTVDRKFREPWTGRIGARIVVLSNELPNFGDQSGAIVGRFVALVLTKSWLGKEDVSLERSLVAEAPGILNWALAGLARLDDRGRFTEPTSSVEAVITMRDTASPTSAFVRDLCEVGSGNMVSVDSLWSAWKTWAEDNGMTRPGTKQVFGRNLRAVIPGLKVIRPRSDEDGRERQYAGLKLKAQSSGSRTTADQTDIADRDDGPVRDGPRSNALHFQFCRVCGTTLDPALGEDTHPGCEP